MRISCLAKGKRSSTGGHNVTVTGGSTPVTSFGRLLKEGGVVDDFESWRARVALDVVLTDALARRDVVDALHEEGLRAEEAREAVRESDSAITRVRMEQDRFAAIGGPAGRPARWSLSLRDWLWSVLAAAIGFFYLFLLRLSWPHMPLYLQLFGAIGMVAALLLSFLVAVEKVPVFRDLIGGRYGAMVPDEDLVGLGDRRKFVLTEIVLPALRQFISDGRRLIYGTELTVRRVAGLYSADGEEGGPGIIQTMATRQLRRIFDRSTSGNVALAGCRGVGKTTSIAAMARGVFGSADAKPPLAVLASAPAHYEARDFVLHLHALLCKEVIARLGQTWGTRHTVHDHFSRVFRASQRRRELRKTIRRMMMAITVVLVAAVAAIVLWGRGIAGFVADVGALARVTVQDFPVSAARLWEGAPLPRVLALVIVGAVALYVLVTLAGIALTLVHRAAGRAWRRRRRRGTNKIVYLLDLAEDQLDRIRFLQSHTTGWSGKISMPLKGQASRSWSTERAEQQLTHPEVVDEFRQFAKVAAEILESEGVADRVVIAIDELDKIGEPEKSHQFINDVKGIFDVTGCLFLVSVSDDAITNFEQRGVAVRDAFDSAFSEMVRLESFTLDESRLWISSRLVGISEQFCHLSHCLSGGLPRDLRRYTIEMLDVTADTYTPTLRTVTDTLLRRELARRTHAFTSIAGTLGHNSEVSRLASSLLLVPVTGNALEMAEFATDLVRDVRENDAETVNNLRRYSACFVLFCATVLEVFDNHLCEERLHATDLDKLTTTRQQMPMHPHHAWQILTDFRKAHGLDMTS